MADRPARKIDRRRRERVIEGALDVIYEHGVEGMTHRRVAEAAGVPLAATTYYFRTLEDLLEAAMSTAAERDIAALRERFAVSRPVDSLTAVLTSYVYDITTVRHREAVIIGELFVAAFRRPRLREIGEAWNQAWIEVLTPSVGDAAELVTIAIGGLSQQAVLTEEGPERGRIQSQIDRLLKVV